MKNGFLLSVKYGRVTIVTIVLAMFFFSGCKRNYDDVNDAIVTGKVYRFATPIDSVPSDSGYLYTDWKFKAPVESALIFVEGDAKSSVPYKGPDLQCYTDSTGQFSIHVPLGMDSTAASGYPYYTKYADIVVWGTYKTVIFSWGGGITLGFNKNFEVFPIALMWFDSSTSK